jgi:hypothetical protein
MRLVERHSPLAVTPAGSPDPAAVPDGSTVTASRRTWLNLAPIVAALLALTALAVVPWIICRRLAAARATVVGAGPSCSVATSTLSLYNARRDPSSLEA